MKLSPKIILPCLLALACLAATLAPSPAFAANDKAKEFFNQGVTAEKAGKVDEAIVAYKGAITADASYTEAYMNLGALYFQKNQLDDAAKTFQSATEKDPKNVDAFANLGRVQYKMKKYVEAEAAFKTATSLNPSDAGLHKELAKVYFDKASYPEAITELDACHKAGGGDTLTYYMLGKSYEKESKATEAIAAYQKSNSMKDNYRANYGLGIIYLNQENFTEAAKAFKAALKAEPKGYLAAYNYAIAVESQNKDAIDQNIANWQEFIRLAKNNPKAKNDVAIAEAHVKDLKDSKAAKGSGN